MPVPHSCLTCGQTFTTVNFMLLHAYLFHHLVHPFCCVLCDLSFQSSVAWQSHQHAKHPQAFITPPVALASSPLTGAPLTDEAAAGDGLDTSEVGSDGGTSEDDGNRCALCNFTSQDIARLNTHLEHIHHWCFICTKGFKTAKARSQHDDSLAHAPRAVLCPSGSNCKCKFKSASGVAHHMENGQHMNRHEVTRRVQAMDRNNVVSINRRLEWPATSTTSKFIATEDSFNGKHYVCFLCQKKLRSLAGLNGHLNSAAHDASEFKCPRCRKEFKIVSALTQHLESRACAHLTAAIGSGSEEVESYIQRLSGGSRQLHF